MEKISGIIPANARTRSVEVAAAQPARPGAPSMGRPMGRVTKTPAFVEDRLSLSKDLPAAAPALPGTYTNTKPEATRAKVVEDLAKKFFDSNPKVEVRGSDTTKSEEVLKAIEDTDALVPVAIEPEKKFDKSKSSVAF